jgi:hypothetical protein
MKVIKSTTIKWLVVILAIFFSCSETSDEIEQIGQVQFTVVSKNETSSGRVDAGMTPESLQITVIKESSFGDNISKRIGLNSFGNTYVSEPLSLPTGAYSLTEFMVLDKDDNVIYITPKEGSSLAYLVDLPLPLIMFTVSENGITKVTPEVLSVNISVPEDFGYSSFSFSEVEILNFLLSVFILDDIEGWVLTGADIEVLAENQVIYDGQLLAQVNHVMVRDSYSQYTIHVTKPGYLDYQKTFTHQDLGAYFESVENGPLDIILIKENSGLVMWNKLGSQFEVENSAYGPNLTYYSGSTGIDAPANREYVPGKFENAITIAPGHYSVTQRIHNLVLKNLQNYINPEKGTIECFFLQNSSPSAYNHNPYRIFDGSFGLNSGMGFQVNDRYEDGSLITLQFSLRFNGSTSVPIEYPNMDKFNGKWVHVAAAWDRNGIDDSPETVRLFINGEKVASSTQNNWGTTVGDQADIAGGNDQNIARQFYLDNMKIWNYAKNEFNLNTE